MLRRTVLPLLFKALAMILMLLCVRLTIHKFGYEEYGRISLLLSTVAIASIFDIGLGIKLRNTAATYDGKMDLLLRNNLLRNILYLFLISLLPLMLFSTTQLNDVSLGIVVAFILSLRQSEHVLIGLGRTPSVYFFQFIIRLCMLIVLYYCKSIQGLWIWIFFEISLGLSYLIFLYIFLYDSHKNITSEKEILPSSLQFFYVQMIGVIIYGSLLISLKLKFNDFDLLGRIDEAWKYMSVVLVAVNIYTQVNWANVRSKVSLKYLLSLTFILFFGLLTSMQALRYFYVIDLNVLTLSLLTGLIACAGVTKIINSILVSKNILKDLWKWGIWACVFLFAGIIASNSLEIVLAIYLLTYLFYLVVNWIIYVKNYIPRVF